jgi:hypothetical protein
MKCARPMWKQIFIMSTYANMNMERTQQNYSARSCLKLMLNKLKEMKGPTPIYTPLGILFKKVFNKASMCASSKEACWIPF